MVDTSIFSFRSGGSRNFQERVILLRQSATNLSSGYLLWLRSPRNAQCYQLPAPPRRCNQHHRLQHQQPARAIARQGGQRRLSSSNTLTIGRTTQTSNSFLDGAISIELLPPSNRPGDHRVPDSGSRRHAGGDAPKRPTVGRRSAQATCCPSALCCSCRELHPGSFHHLPS